MLEHLEGTDRLLVGRVLDRFERNVVPVLPNLRAQVVHGDLSLGNILVDREGNATGIVDFGDMTHTALACDLVAAVASLVRGREDTVDALRSVLTGYGEITAIEPEEAAVLGDLLLGRLCTTLLVSAWRVRQYPENADYIQAWDDHSWQLLRILDDMGFDRAGELLRELSTAAASSSLPPREDDEELLRRRRRVLGGALSEISYERPVHLVRGEGAWMFDAEGNAFLDSYNNVPVVGHSHPRVVAAIAEQSRRLNTNTRYLHENVVALAERLTASMPEELDTCVFVNSGSEANDAAMRFALRVTGRTGAIVTRFAYHGVSIATGDLSPEEWPAGSQPNHVETIPAPDPAGGEDWQARAVRDIDHAVEALAARGVDPALVMIDTGYTSDGIFAPPLTYLQEIVRRTHDHGALFVADEVQAGYGRAGSHLWSFQDSGVVPDFVTLGKPMGNGFPVAAVVMRREIAERYAEEEAFFSTFGGNPVACAAALAVLDVLRDEDLIRHAAEVGAHLQAALLRLAQTHPLISGVRGRGLLIGVELRDGDRPAGAEADAVSNAMRERRVLIGTTGPGGNVLKIRPPLVITRAEADTIATTLEDALRALGR
jgi:4-aminobutyrate aminotransferase-like enzyme